MNRMIKLASTFIKINAMSKPTDKGQKIKIAILSVFSFSFACPSFLENFESI